MAWIESHQTLQRHPKVIGLAAKARLSKAAVIGHLHMLWWWAMDYAPTGDLSQFDPSLVAAAAEWDGDSDNWMTLLKEFRWVDQDGHLHDWEQYAGRLLEIREKDRKRKSERRAEDVRRMSGGCPADVRSHSKVPNPTQPNLTKPDPTPPIDKKVWEPSETHLRFNTLFGRKATTAWTDKEKRALANLGVIPEDDMKLIESRYARVLPPSEDYRRRELLTLLNNFQGELDKERNYKPSTNRKRVLDTQPQIEIPEFK